MVEQACSHAVENGKGYVKVEDSTNKGSVVSANVKQYWRYWDVILPSARLIVGELVPVQSLQFVAFKAERKEIGIVQRHCSNSL